MNLVSFLFEPSPEYVAGLFDGEGCVQVRKSVRKRQRGRDVQNHATYFQLCVSISNTNLDILNKLVDEYGGYVVNTTKENTSHKSCYDWRVSSRAAIVFLTQIAPYVFIKSDQVKLALQFYELAEEEVRVGLQELKKKRQTVNAKP